MQSTHPQRRAAAPLLIRPELHPGYRLRRLRGRGNFGQVWEAETDTGEPVALKFLHCVGDQASLEVRSLQSSIQFIARGMDARPDEAAKLQRLRRAVLDRTTVRFRYHTRHPLDGGHQPKLRDADPYALMHVGGAWHLAAYCHLRRAVRTFRLDRMDDLTTLGATFERPADFHMHRRDLFEPGSCERSATIRGFSVSMWTPAPGAAMGVWTRRVSRISAERGRPRLER